MEDRMSLRDAAYQATLSYLSAFDDRELKALRLHQLIFEEVERGIVDAVLQRCQYNQSWAADVLGIARNSLRKKIQELDINVQPHQTRRTMRDE
ncbi:MAG: hypothetical protein FJ161_01485 [Gammaproteobacteria bacterium]|nr:hypothetical protein [Gammaproteobacteria bacterium]